MIYDVVIVGGGTAGCAAAYNCAKLGLKTLLLEKNIHLGGAMTSELVIPAMKSGDNQINTDFFNALVNELNKLGGQIDYMNNSGWFNPELTKIALDNLLKFDNLDIIFGAEILSAEKKLDHVVSLQITSEILSPYIEKIYTDKKISQNNRILSEYIGAKYYIDATGNCELGKILECNFLQDNLENQPTSLRFIMSGVDNSTFAKWIVELDKDREVTTCEEIDGVTHFSTAYTWDNAKDWALKPFFDDAVDKGILKDVDRNYFQIFTVAGTPDSVAFNCPRILENIENKSFSEQSKIIIEARSSIYRIADFCKKYLKGFEKAYISNIANALGVRVSSRIKGKYVYTKDDLILGKKFDNPALISNYPIDIHSSKKDCSTLKKYNEYQLPIESLISADYDNLFVAGRCLSADFESQAALRVQPSCFSMGEAVAKYIQSLNNLTL